MSLLDVKHSKSLGREDIEVHSPEELPAQVRTRGAHLIEPVSGETAPQPSGLFTSPLFIGGVAAAVVGAGAAILGGVEMKGAADIITDEVSLADKKDAAANDSNVYTR